MKSSPESPITEPLIGRGMAPPTSIGIVFEPMLQLVSSMRRFVLTIYQRILADEAASSEMALVTHELLENAVKFNTDSGTMLRVSLTREADHHIVVIRTRNRAAPEDIRVAQDLVARVRDAEDPYLLYLQMIRSASLQSDGSGLGLARIRAETAMTVEVNVVGDEIELVARAQIPIGGAP